MAAGAAFRAFMMMRSDWLLVCGCCSVIGFIMQLIVGLHYLTVNVGRVPTSVGAAMSSHSYFAWLGERMSSCSGE